MGRMKFFMKKKNKLLIFVIMLCISLSFCFSSFAADTTTETPTEEINDLGAGVIESMLHIVFGNAIIPDKSDGGTGSIFDPWEMLQNSTELALKAMEDITQGKLYSVFTAIGVIFMFIYFLMDLSTSDMFMTSTNKRVTAEEIIKPLMKLLFCIIFLCNVKWILYFILGLSQGAFNQAINTLTIENVNMSADVVDKLMTVSGYVKNPSGLDMVRNIGCSMQLFISFAIPWLVSLVCNFLLIYVILSRVVNIVIQGILAPIAMADIYGQGNSIRDTRAWGYIRNFAGLCFQAVVIVLVLYVVNSLIGVYATQLSEGLSRAAHIGDFVNLGIQVTVLKVVQVGTAMGSANEAKKLFSGG